MDILYYYVLYLYLGSGTFKIWKRTHKIKEVETLKLGNELPFYFPFKHPNIFLKSLIILAIQIQIRDLNLTFQKWLLCTGSRHATLFHFAYSQINMRQLSASFIYHKSYLGLFIYRTMLYNYDLRISYFFLRVRRNPLSSPYYSVRYLAEVRDHFGHFNGHKSDTRIWNATSLFKDIFTRTYTLQLCFAIIEFCRDFGFARISKAKKKKKKRKVNVFRNTHSNYYFVEQKKTSTAHIVCPSIFTIQVRAQAKSRHVVTFC